MLYFKILSIFVDMVLIPINLTQLNEQRYFLCDEKLENGTVGNNSNDERETQQSQAERKDDTGNGSMDS